MLFSKKKKRFRIYESMAKHLELNYFRWENPDRSQTVFHEDVFEKFNVDKADIEKIKSANQRPYWLQGVAGLAAEKYWINQDTVVSIDEIKVLVKSALQQGINYDLYHKKNRNEL